MTTPPVVHLEAESKFSLTLPEGEAYLQYIRRGQVLDFAHTFVPEAARSRGAAEQVVLAGFQYAQQHGLTVIPSCPYVSHAFLRRHPEYQPLIRASD